jgi:hypothetical protein
MRSSFPAATCNSCSRHLSPVRNLFKTCRGPILLILFATFSGSLLAQTVYPVAECVEYFTYPGIASGSNVYHASEVGPFDDATGAVGPSPGNSGSVVLTGASGVTGYSGSVAYLGHFGTFSTFSVDKSIQQGSEGNYLYPGPLAYPGQPRIFSSGYTSVTRMGDDGLRTNWSLLENVATMRILGAKDLQGNLIPPTPTCSASFVPSTALQYTQPGTYVHQFLGQVDAGPPAASTQVFTLTSLSGSPGVTFSNLSYVPHDPSGHDSSGNSNSIYGDIVISGGTGSTGVLVQLSVNGRVLVDGAVAVTH